MINLSALTGFFLNYGLINHVIGVSHAVRENDMVKTGSDPRKHSVIPNAIDSSNFVADPSQRNPVGTINICYMARITYRKGADLLINLIPRIC